ncbi:MAG TPA: hypothetical protein VG435_10915 [Acidimicrobiales bacterium]|jgi:ABC-type transport system involved in multi-copper enzyme maturation permease subunit|nr:hypothetical protein [Acidimicrobiales bacterium]
MTAAALARREARRRLRVQRGLTWVTWRQHRLGLAGVLGAFGGLGLYMLINGLAVHHAFTNLGLSTCGGLSSAGCQTQLSGFEQQYSSTADHLPHFLMLLPGLIGVFIGAPLVAREFESGTFRFVWTQGRSRVQWIVTKLVLLGMVLALSTLGFSALFTWWYGPFNAISGRMTAYGAYEVSGLVFAARTLFGFALGALLGLLIRRVVPAMVATGIGWITVMWVTMTYLRPSIRPPITIIGRQGKGPIPTDGALPFNADIVHNWMQDAAGHHVAYEQVINQAIAANGGNPPSPQGLDAWMAQQHYSQWVSYLPNNWFWHFQTTEATGYFVVAIVLAVVTVLALRRRVI